MSCPLQGVSTHGRVRRPLKLLLGGRPLSLAGISDTSTPSRRLRLPDPIPRAPAANGLSLPLADRCPHAESWSWLRLRVGGGSEGGGYWLTWQQSPLGPLPVLLARALLCLPIRGDHLQAQRVQGNVGVKAVKGIDPPCDGKSN